MDKLLKPGKLSGLSKFLFSPSSVSLLCCPNGAGHQSLDRWKLLAMRLFMTPCISIHTRKHARTHKYDVNYDKDYILCADWGNYIMLIRYLILLCCCSNWRQYRRTVCRILINKPWVLIQRSTRIENESLLFFPVCCRQHIAYVEHFTIILNVLRRILADFIVNIVYHYQSLVGRPTTRVQLVHVTRLSWEFFINCWK